MGPYAFSQAFLSGFFAFAAISSLTLWRRTRTDWTLLLLAMVCAIGSIQTIAVLVLATTDVISTARYAQLVRGLCGLMSFASLAWLYAEIARVRARPYLWFVTATALCVAVVAVLGIPLLGSVTGITLRRTIGEHIELAVRLAPDLWNVEADPNQCGRALVNVAINARDAMPAGGCLTIETANVLKDESVSVDPASAPIRYVMVSVADTGQGMTPDIKARLFEPFFTTKELGKGTGLGLAVVDGIVRQTGGHVDVDSQPGHGTVFRIFFPATDRSPSGEVPREDAESRLRGSETVLLVEDDPGVRSLTRTGLERYGYCVLAAADGDEAVRVAREHGRPIDLVVTDVLMPGSTGPQTVARLRERDPSLAALFISGYTADALPHEATMGEAAFLQKPFTPAVLAARMRSILDA